MSTLPKRGLRGARAGERDGSASSLKKCSTRPTGLEESELTTHEEVVEEVAAHPQRLSTPVKEDAAKVDDDAEGEAADHRDGHERAKVVDDVGEGEETGDVETGGDDKGGVEAGQGVAEVREGDVVERSDGEACLARGRYVRWKGQ
jgi:hypothetical protein